MVSSAWNLSNVLPQSYHPAAAVALFSIGASNPNHSAKTIAIQ
jgi:hypothetical protein